MGSKATRRKMRKGASWGKMVKWIEPVPLDEFNSSPLLMSIKSSMHKDDDNTFIFQDQKMDLVERRIRKVYPIEGYDKNPMTDPFNESTSLVCVKIHYRDGSWEYGFKYWREQYVPHPEKRNLLPIYLKDGYIDEFTGEVVDSYDMDDSYYTTFVPYRLLRKLPTYNEFMRRRVKSQEKSNKETSEDEQICDVIDSSYVRRNGVKFSVPPLKGKPKDIGKMAWAENMNVLISDYIAGNPQNEWYEVRGTDYGSGQMRLVKCNDIANRPRFFKFSYLKSCYEDVIEHKTVGEIYPVSSLLSIMLKDSWRDEETELWNNLDQTVAGNV